MKNVAVFASGNGSNFEAIVRANLKCNIKVLVCNKSDAYVITRAKNLQIDCAVIDETMYPVKKDFEKEVFKVLKKYEIDLIVLAGYMKIFSEDFINNHNGPIVNIHPSLLPKYRGKGAIRRAFEANEKQVGVSVHYVDSGIDTGKVIRQEVIEVYEGDTLKEVEDRVHHIEHVLYPKVLEELL